MKAAFFLFVVAIVVGCGDRELLMDTKIDAPLRQKLSSLEGGGPEVLSVIGKCEYEIDGTMRQDLIDAGADVQSVTGEIFTALISSDRILDLVSVEAVSQIQLSNISKPLSK